MVSNFSNIFLISVLILGLIVSPFALTEFTFAQEQGKPEGVGKPENKTKPEGIGKPEDVGKPEDDEEKRAQKIAEKEARIQQKIAEKEERLAEKASERQARALEKLEQLQQKLMQRIDKLEQRQQALLAKVQSGEYLGPTLGGDSYTNQYYLSFDALDATGIGNSETDTFLGHITLENVVTRGNNLKLKVTDCELIGTDNSYYCVFGKARATSSGPGGEKNSMIIIAFMEDFDENRNTLRITLSADVPIKEISASPEDVTIKSPQSKIARHWFIGGDATLELTSSSEPLDTGILTGVVEEQEEAAEEAAEAEQKAAEELEVNLEESIGISAETEE